MADRSTCGELHLVLRGELDVATLDVAREHLMVLVHAASGDMVLELGELQFVSVAGTRLLAEVARACREEGRDLRLQGASPQLLQTFLLCDFHLDVG